jgi:hypothetical protein
MWRGLSPYCEFNLWKISAGFTMNVMIQRCSTLGVTWPLARQWMQCCWFFSAHIFREKIKSKLTSNHPCSRYFFSRVAVNIHKETERNKNTDISKRHVRVAVSYDVTNLLSLTKNNYYIHNVSNTNLKAHNIPTLNLDTYRLLLLIYLVLERNICAVFLKCCLLLW